MARRQRRRNQAKTVAVGCDPLPESFHGKEGVDGSSPSEGSAKAPQNGVLCNPSRPTLPPLARVWKAFWKNRSFGAYPAAASWSAPLKIEPCSTALRNGPAALERPGPGTGKELR